MGQIRSYRDLQIWQRGMGVAKDVYLLTRLLPKEELFCLSSQMRRAAISIPSNIAEGHVKSRAHFRNHLSTAMGSLAELETQLLLGSWLYPQTQKSAEELMTCLDELNRMMRAITQKLGE